MEIKASLNKPYTEDERMNFIIEENHNLGYEIKETKTALEAWGYTEEEKEEQEKEAKNLMTLTSADVERAIYKAKGMDFEDLIEFVKNSELTGLDVKALKIELKANNFYRGNKYINQIGTMLGYTSEDLDYLFKNKELPTEESEDEE